MERTRPSRPETAEPELSGPGLRLDDLKAPRAADGESIPESEAQQVWRVAARLQAEAARRLDARSEQLAQTHRSEDEAPRAAFSRAEVEEIATAAGIDPSFVALAWREVETDALRSSTVSDERHRRASAFLGTDAERLGVTRTFRATPEEVLAAMQRVLPADPYRLTLAEVVGDAETLADATLLFDVPKLMQQMTETGGYTPFSYSMSTSDLDRLAVTLHPLGQGRTEATVTVDLRPGKAKNLTVGAWLTAVLALGMGGAGFFLGVTATGGAAGTAAGLGLFSALLMALVMFYGYRAAYRAGLRKGEKALGEMLRAVDVDLRSGGAFARPSAPPRRAGGDDENLTTLLSSL